jgi:Trypsin-co-occurring domain 1
VQPAAQALISRLRALADAPDEVGVEFGLELSAEAGAFIAAASSTANFKVTLSWHRSSPPPTATSAGTADGG